MIKYYQMVNKKSNIFNLRLAMVKDVQQYNNISATAKKFEVTRPIVRKWVRRYEKEGLRGLCDRSRTPHHIPHKTSKELEEKVIELRKSHPAWGPDRLKMHYELPISAKTIGRIIKESGLVKKKKRKWEKKRDLREMKKGWKALGYIQIDTKDLCDIEKYWPQMQNLKLPRYEYTARDVRTGGSWHAYAYFNNTVNSALFVGYLLNQLNHYGVEMKEVIVQTDNGSEFIGHVTKKDKSAFEKVAEIFEVSHVRIPPSSPTWNSDVETFHRMVEDEFYDLEDYVNQEEFCAKAYAYQIYANYKRKNRNRGWKTPVEILKEVREDISPGVFNFRPIILDSFLEYMTGNLPEYSVKVGRALVRSVAIPEYHDEKGGYHVGCSTKLNLPIIVNVPPAEALETIP